MRLRSALMPNPINLFSQIPMTGQLSHYALKAVLDRVGLAQPTTAVWLNWANRSFTKFW